MKTIIDKQTDNLLKKFHTLCGKAELKKYEKAAIVESYGKSSSRELSAHDLIDAIGKIEKILNPELEVMDVWRKRVIAAIGGYLKALNKDQNISEIKAIACRATDIEKFNDIPRERLINIYHAFTNKQKDIKAVAKITAGEIEFLTISN